MVSSTAAAGETRETRERTSRLARRSGFIGRTLYQRQARAKPASGCRPAVAQDGLGDGAEVLADDVVARPRHEAGPAGGELEAEGRLLLGLAVGADDLLSGELLDLRANGAALGRGLAEPLRGVEAEVGRLGGSHQGDERDPLRQVRGQAAGEEGHDVGTEGVTNEDDLLLVPERQVVTEDALQVLRRAVRVPALEEIAQRVPSHDGNPPLGQGLRQSLIRLRPSAVAGEEHGELVAAGSLGGDRDEGEAQLRGRRGWRLGFATPEVRVDRTRIPASETTRRPRGLRNDIVSGPGRLYGPVSRWPRMAIAGALRRIFQPLRNL